MLQQMMAKNQTESRASDDMMKRLWSIPPRHFKS